MSQFYINTVLLEKNRWETERVPSIKVSEWVDTLISDDLDGIELWENHALKAEEGEVENLKHSSLPVKIYNSYVRFEEGFINERIQAAEMVNKLGAKKVKFNFGNEVTLRHDYIRNLLDWKTMLPLDCQLICECHPGTIMEDPLVVSEVFNDIGMDNLGAIVHPFHPQTDLQSWFDHIGAFIVHAHVSLYEEQSFHLLESKMDFVRDRLKILKDQNYEGSYSIEFTEGTASEFETPSLLYTNALRDFEVLRKELQTS
ncbi:hypothetical protein [Alkalihalobacillus sp. TS-13]|uniref:hypothetical protein n=1 Tax=Alkalihalobacillus sp. TS-13 TaxID=2842455 RepID=UPI001C88777C|nr:hypothetical protein [Alkalihalobacillus sp. TS-13]